MSEQTWQRGEGPEGGVPLLVGGGFDFSSNVLIKPAFDFVFLVLAGYVAVNVDRFTIGAGTIKCIRVYV